MTCPKLLIFFLLICFKFSSNDVKNEFKVEKLGNSFLLEDSSDLKPEWLILLPNAETVLVKNGSIFSRYKRKYPIECVSKENCHILRIKNFTKELVGAYSKGNEKWTAIAGYEGPLSFNCNSNNTNKCDYNSSTKTLTVREDQPVNIECSTLLWNNVDDENKFKLGLTNFENNTELVRKIVPEDGLFKIQITSIYTHKTFSRNSDKKLTCVFSYLNNLLTDSIDVNLVVEYGPEFEIKDYEPVLILGLHSTLTCPIIGYPLVYFWKKLGSDSKEIIGEKEFSLPNEIGEYRYQCQAKMSNIMYPPVNFDVKVTEEANILKVNFSVFVNQLYLFHLKIDKNPKLPSEEEMGEVEIMIKNFGDRFILRCPSTQKQNYSEIEWWYQDGTENKIEIFVNGIFNENFNHIVKCINERNENKCEALEILNFNEEMVGEITKAYKSNDKDANCVFILTSFVNSLSMKCEEINTSNYCSIIDLDQASKKLFVKEDQLVDIQCSVTILSAVEMSPEYLGLHMSDCEDLDDEITSIYSIKYTGLQEYTFKTNCKRNFYRSDKSISCSILDFDRYSYLKSKVLDVVVEYGPIEENFDNDYFNKTISYGKSVVLKCPVNGYPISYIWKDDKSNKYSFGKYFTLHRHLETRLHEYECTAVIGKHGKKSKSYKFFINII